jgi:multidrug efflux pump subunit AcrA (membrane-fusion protein)
MVQVPTATASFGEISASIRVNGTIAAKERQSILAPRIQGSRADMNRGGGGGGGGGRSGGGGGGAAMMVMGGGGGPQNDFSLVLMKLAKAGTRVKKGEVIAEFDPQMQIQRLEDYEDSLIQNEASL